jgi:hypothetical protein
MAALTQAGTTREIAAKRFPRTPAQHIRGSGRYAHVLKCGMPWKVLLYETREERDDAWQRYQLANCGSYRCVHDHVCVDL